MNAKNIKNGIPKVGQETLNNNADMIERIMYFMNDNNCIDANLRF